MTDTRARLAAATLDALRTNGVAGLSARTVATGAGVNQALVFYHYGTVAEIEIEAVLERLLASSVIADLADLPGSAGAIAAGFLGLEPYDGVDRAGATSVPDALEHLGVLAEVVEDLGPVARRAVRRLHSARSSAC